MEVQKLIAMAVVSGRVPVVPAIGCDRVAERGWQEGDIALTGGRRSRAPAPHADPYPN